CKGSERGWCVRWGDVAQRTGGATRRRVLFFEGRQMERAVKEEVVADLKARMAKAASVVLADFRGLTVEAVTGLRREFRANQCEYKVVKNTLLGLAIKGTPMEGLGKLLEGPTAVAFSWEDPAAPATIGQNVAKGEGEKHGV